ncbi:hypothetical protein Pst134EA_032219 [Puccinia striiformis f. sp. tritici]|uniref:uncharacterized protein n=1 Tax=Puccinia striiformis f. sp. tritici TaxID=168172 RepID=UPI0020077EAB|nr:uncharacterized protein Pst134EA_032219 [Puccinia striiformis f. sp. tritici]KAH9441818.1 hypothetical protein Pst134EA_032219 [Puccinia striiformis f. sp. tritici]
MYLKVLKLYDDKRSNSINGSVDPVYNITWYGSLVLVSMVRKVAGGLAAVLNTVGGTKNEDKSNSILPELYHPLISIYFLVREKIRRENLWSRSIRFVYLICYRSTSAPAPPSAYMSELGAHGQLLASGIHTSNEIASVRLPNKNRNTMAGSELDGQQRDQAALLLDMHQKGSSSTKDRNRIMSIRPNTATELGPGLLTGSIHPRDVVFTL